GASGSGGGGWDGSASRRQEAQEGRAVPDQAPVGGADAGLRRSRTVVGGGEVNSSSVEERNRSREGRSTGDDPRRGPPQAPTDCAAPNDDDNDDDYDHPTAKVLGGAARGGEAFGSAAVARSASPDGRGVQELLLHTSDAQVTPIVGSRCVEPGRGGPH
ncbi:unnamed protein product, partial [Laminaria digitata]